MLIICRRVHQGYRRHIRSGCWDDGVRGAPAPAAPPGEAAQQEQAPAAAQPRSLSSASHSRAWPDQRTTPSKALASTLQHHLWIWKIMNMNMKNYCNVNMNIKKSFNMNMNIFCFFVFLVKKTWITEVPYSLLNMNMKNYCNMNMNMKIFLQHEYKKLFNMIYE